MRHKSIPKWVVLLRWVYKRADPLKIEKTSFLKGPLICFWFEKIILKLKLRAIFIDHLTQNNIALLRRRGTHFVKSVLGEGDSPPGNMLHIVIESDKSPPQSQSIISHLDKIEKFLFCPGII